MTAYRSGGTVGLIAEVVACWADRPSDFCLYLDLAAHQVETYAALDHGVPVHGFFQAHAVERRALPVLRGISHHTGIQHRYWQEFEAQMYHEVLSQLERSPLEGIGD